MTRLKWLQLTPVVAALMSASATASAADQAAPTLPPADQAQSAPSTAAPEITPAPKTPVTTQATPAAQPLPPPAAAAEELPPGSFKIPGTKTTLTLSGYAQLDAMYDFRGRNPNIEGTDYAIQAANIPLNNSYDGRYKDNQLYLTARTSRIGFTTKTESNVADLTVKIEGDFNSGNLLSGQTFTNSVLFRLRHAYGALSGKYGTLLIGQSWSTFLDLPTYAETVDFNGPGSIPLIRQPQIRYTAPLGSRVSLALAVENAPGTDQSTDTPTTRKQQTVPDLIAVLGTSGDWGSASVGVVATSYKGAQSDVTPPATPAGSYFKEGWGARAAAAIKLPWKDTFRAYVAGGNGIGRYLLNAGGGGESATLNGAGDDVILWQALAYHVNYTHVWNDWLRSNVVWSETFIGRNAVVDAAYQGLGTPGGAANGPTNWNKRVDQLFLNTFFTLTKQVEFGLEYSWNERHTFGLDNIGGVECNGGAAVPCSQVGTEHRIASYAHFNFF